MDSRNKSRLLILSLFAIATGLILGKFIPDALKDSTYRKKPSKGTKYFVVSIGVIMQVIITSGFIYILMHTDDFTEYIQNLLN